MRKPAAILLLTLASAAAAESVPDSYEALFESAVRAVTWDLADNWAYTETSTGTDGTFVGRYDPRLPDSERWELLSVDGRVPTPEEAAAFLEDRAEHDSEAADRDDDDRDVDAMVDPGTLRLVEETDDYWLLGFIPTEDDNDELGRKVMQRMNGTVKIVKDGGHLAEIDIRSNKPIRPRVGVKMSKFLMHMTFAPATEDGPVVMRSMDFALKLSAFLLLRVNESESVAYSDFEFAGESVTIP